MNDENGLQGKNRKIALYIRHVYLVLLKVNISVNLSKFHYS